MEDQSKQQRYVLVTPARNEADFIEGTLKAIVAQTVLPEKWAIVSDASTDETEEIVERYAKDYPFIELVVREAGTGRDFGSKVYAFNAGYERMDGLEYSFIGNLDADVSLDPDYFEKLLGNFNERPKLGIAGGAIFEAPDGYYRQRHENRIRSVAGAVQLFRRECYEQVGGYTPIQTGGIDTVAEVTARMHEWEVRSFPELMVRHKRPTSTALGTGIYAIHFRSGRRDYALGIHPIYEACKLFARLLKSPKLIGSFGQTAGYLSAMFGKDKIAVSDDVYRFVRREQLSRLTRLPARLLGGGKRTS